MTARRPSLEELASLLVELDPDSLGVVVRARLLREPVEQLPPLGRDEDPADILIDLAEWLRERQRAWEPLAEACARVADMWAGIYQRWIPPEPIGELHYLCARIGAIEARHGIARVIRREDLRGILLPGGEGLQLRALRCMAGLLARVPRETRSEFLPLFIEALDVPQHLPIALTALAAFDPEGRERHFVRARDAWPLHFDQVIGRVERNVELLRAEMG